MKAKSSKAFGIPMVAIFILLCCSVFFLSGCGDNGAGPEKNEVEDKGTYTLTVEQTLMDEPKGYLQPTSVWSYPGGGGLFIIIMEPGEDFEGDVQLTINADPALHAQLLNEKLTVEKPVSEVEVYPDTTIEVVNERFYFVNDTLLVIAEHGGVKDTLDLEIKIGIPNDKAKPNATGLHNVFIQWIQDEHPELGITTGQEWFSWSINPRFLLGGGHWLFLNSNWEMRVSWAVVPSPPVWILVRQRGNVMPLLAARRIGDGPFQEIPVEDFQY